MGDLAAYEEDPRLFLFTSLTAGSSHIITATSRLETILSANKLPFQAVDLATDETARRLWQRRARGKKLPGLVKDGFVVGDLEEVEEWNEFGELKENIGPLPAAAKGNVQGVNIRPAPKPPAQSAGNAKVEEAAAAVKTKGVALPGAAEIAARSKEQSKPIAADPVEGEKAAAVETMATAPAEKEESINAAKAMLKDEQQPVEHLSAPPSAVASGTATPEPETTEGEKSAVAEEEKSTNAARERLKNDTTSIDHLSAPPSAVPSGTATPAETNTSTTETSAAKEEETPSPPQESQHQHRGSEVKDVSLDETKRVEDENALKERKDEDEDTRRGVEGLKVGEEEKPQEQEAKAAEDASKSVQD